MRKETALVICICLFIGANPVKANDWNLPVPPPALNASLPITLKEQKIAITRDKISVTLDVLNEATAEFRYRFSFAAPEFGWVGLGENYPDKSYSELSVITNGQNITLEKSYRAFLKDEDITETLNSYSINPNLVSNPDFWLKNNAKSQMLYTELIAKNFFWKDGLKRKTTPQDIRYNPSWEGEELYPFSPNWTVRNSYAWEQIFPSGIEQNISYSYRPLWGAALEHYPDSTPEYYIPKFSWQLAKTFLGNGKELTGSELYIVQWLTLPVDSILWKDNNGTLTIEASFSDEGVMEPGPVLIILSYGNQIVSGKSTVSLKTTNARSDSITVVTVRK